MWIFKNVSLKVLLLGCIVSLLVLSSLGTLINLRTSQTVSAELVTLRGNAIELALQSKSARLAAYQVQQWLTDISATRALNGLDDGFTNAETWANTFRECTVAMKKILADDPEHLALIAEGERAFDPYYEMGVKMAQAYIDGGPEVGNLLMSDFDEQAERINTSMSRVTAYAQENMETRIETLNSHFDEANRINLVFNVGFILGLLLLGAVVLLGVIKPLALIEAQMAEIAAGGGDLSKRIPVTSNNEIGKLAASFNRFSEHLEQIIYEVRRTCKALMASSTLLSRSSDVTSQQIEQSTEETNGLSLGAGALETRMTAIRGQTQDGTQKLGDVSGSIRELSENIAMISAASNEVSSSTESAASAIEELSAAVSEISSNTTSAFEVSNRAFEQSNRTTELVENMDNKAKSVGKIIEVINKMAERTHMLALNANIEAAKSGKYGKGFAVVADEVKELATETTDATDAIEQEIRAMLDFTEACKKAMTEVSRSNKELNQINESIVAALKEHEVVTMDLASSTAQTVGSMCNVRDNLDKVSNHAQSIAHSANELDRQMHEIDRRSVEVETQVIEIRGQLGRVNSACEVTFQENQTVAEQAEKVAALNLRQEELVNRFTLSEVNERRLNDREGENP